MPNHLAKETSPYLLQHANNPVDWYGWGPEALERAKREDKPIFLSIGYSACHWCHVMEHESFENAEIAKTLNESFVSIKVDREERPDLDQIYMQAVQIMTGRGGWPMSVFLTPELRPFYGGTYWPPAPRMGMPGFNQVLAAVADAWKNKRAELLEQSKALTESISRSIPAALPIETLSDAPLRAAETTLDRMTDRDFGGFGGAPKFPHSMDLRVLLRAYSRNKKPAVLELATLTLDHMMHGGIYDHLGGGFHRYSVDARWLVPHFEKMLYDNALLAEAYLEAFQVTGNADYARVVEETCDFVLRDMTDEAGGFFSTLDADSEKEEGKFYVWTPDEITAALGAEDAKTFSYVYDVYAGGNFEGKSILNLPKSFSQAAKVLGKDEKALRDSLAKNRATLLALRAKRVWPALDDKVLVSWNGLMIHSLAMAGAVLSQPRYLQAAARAAKFILEKMRTPQGRLLHTARHGKATLSAYLDDYTCLINALVTLYETTFDGKWIDSAVELADMVLAEFFDPDAGGFFYTAADHEQLIARQKDVQDSSVPSGNSMAAIALLRLGKLCGRNQYLDAATRILKQYGSLMADHPTAMGQMLIALDFALGPTPELVLLGPEHDITHALAQFWPRFSPRRVLAGLPTGSQPHKALAPLFEGKPLAPTQPTLYVCENFACQAPAVGADAVTRTLEGLSVRAE